MKYYKTVTLKDGMEVVLRNATINDVKQMLGVFNKTHEETEFLLTYPEETPFTVEDEKKHLDELDKSERAIEIVACYEGKIVGSAGFSEVGKYIKLKHRADFGISVLKDYWGKGIGTELIKGCIDCAKEAGFDLIELEAVAENETAIDLYKKHGFVQYGRNPYGFKTKDGKYQELALMLLKL